MVRKPSLRTALHFSAALLLTMPLWLVLWGYCLPTYSRILGTVTGAILSEILDVPLEGVRVEAQGLFNTRTALVFELAHRAPRLNVGALVFNVPLFLALMCLTPRLPWRRRVRATLAGLGIIVVGHVVFIVLAFRFASAIAGAPEIPTVLGELFLTLPVLLWIIFGYGDVLFQGQAHRDHAGQVKFDGENDDGSLG